MSGFGGARRRLSTTIETLPPEEKKSEERSKLDDVLSRLNGAGRCRIYSCPRGQGEQDYIESVELDANTCDNLEEIIAANYGGGRFYLKFADSTGKHVGSGTVRVDERMHPPKSPQQMRGEPPTPAAPAQSVVDPRSIGDAVTVAVTAALAPALTKIAEAMAAAQQQPKGPDPIALMTFFAAQQQQTIRAMTSATPPATGAAAAAEQPKSFLESFNEIAKTADLLGWTRGEKESLGEKLAVMAVPEIFKLIGPVAAAKLLGGAAVEPTPATPEPAPVAAVEVKEAATPTTRPLSGSRPLTDEQRRQYRARRDAPKTSTAAPAADATPPPRVKDVAPEAVKA